MILGGRLEVLGQVRDAVGQQSDLDLRGARVGVVHPALPNDAGLASLKLRDVHCSSKPLTTLIFFNKRVG